MYYHAECNQGDSKEKAQREEEKKRQEVLLEKEKALREGMAYVGFSVEAIAKFSLYSASTAPGSEFCVANVTADSTADQKGLKQGDKITAIDGRKIGGMHEEEVKQILMGEPFSTVSITTGGETMEIERDCAVPEPRRPCTMLQQILL